MRLRRAVGAVMITVTAVAVAATPAVATPSTSVHTDLAAAPDASQQAMVTSVVRNPDGTVVETSYTPGPGVSSAKLAERLRGSGVANVTVEGEGGLGTLAVAACSQGTARTWPSDTDCFAEWAYNGYARPQLYYIDSSSAAWPVGRAVTRWNETSGIDSVYRTTNSGCPGGGIHCVPVASANYGATGWVGLARRWLNAAGTYYTRAEIQLNDYYGGTEAQRWNTACHEIGHVLGLGHNTSTGSCIYYQQSSQRYPNGDDHTLIERYY
ncbi:hypothetical protein GCM10022225_52610 [Plantactinospora mayteni]|uniref:Peptidase M10 metallopeptidase domain-containing protein n=1 Tax=Plantactinospora mayteni TaxID=566021 RepID=A0ABQ4EYX1_9ACTN|nr:M12 family metallo-peptidase [Plantactinospora mayteni]GIG99822.1 hypothetical protein Pma05_63950 [Plantactinospora mayteni]